MHDQSYGKNPDKVPKGLCEKRQKQWRNACSMALVTDIPNHSRIPSPVSNSVFAGHEGN
jgi:hypothetical protein